MIELAKLTKDEEQQLMTAWSLLELEDRQRLQRLGLTSPMKVMKVMVAFGHHMSELNSDEDLVALFNAVGKTVEDADLVAKVVLHEL